MNREQRNVREFHEAIRLHSIDVFDCDPSTPTMPSLEKRILRAKLMLEECLETIHDGLGITCRVSHGIGSTTLQTVAEECLAKEARWEEIHSGSLVALADGLADQNYVINGTALTAGIDMAPVDEEVHLSNMTKFLDGSFREDGKYVKGPGYIKPDIARVLNAQSLT